MTADIHQVLTDALGLSPMERTALIDELLHSFDSEQAPSQADAWKAEAETRIDAYEAGRISADSAETIFMRINRQ